MRRQIPRALSVRRWPYADGAAATVAKLGRRIAEVGRRETTISYSEVVRGIDEIERRGVRAELRSNLLGQIVEAKQRAFHIQARKFDFGQFQTSDIERNLRAFVA